MAVGRVELLVCPRFLRPFFTPKQAPTDKSVSEDIIPGTYAPCARRATVQ
jgi:hypothetical protein